MATLTITTTARQDAGAQRETAAYNASAKEALTPAQFVKIRLAHLLDAWAAKYEDEDRVSKADLYKRATDEDRATVDAILEKYRTA